MKEQKSTRREFIQTSLKVASGVGIALFAKSTFATSSENKAVVSIVKIKNDKIARAVEQAIDLLGGISNITKGKESILLKPNLVAESPRFTTKPQVVKAVASLMQKAGKNVLIGEGSATGTGFNFINGETFRTRKTEILEKMQQYVFNQLGYTDLAKSLKIPLINLHCGDMAEVQVPNAFVFDKITLHRSLVDNDLLCSIPMMKTHVFAHVTLGMKNLIGVYPGSVYQSVRGHVHDTASKVEPSGTNTAIIDMVRANKLGLTVIDGSMAMEGNGPSEGDLVKMDVIIAGTNPLATDMIAAAVMGFEASEIPKFAWANKAGMAPVELQDIEIRGEKIMDVKHDFKRPTIYSWADVKEVWGYKEI